MNLRKFFLTFCFVSSFVISCFSQAQIEKIRLMFRGDATSTSMTIGWNQIEGAGGTVYYDTLNYGWLPDDTIAATYRWHRRYDRMVDYMGMHNCFSRLSNLLPNRRYYFVIQDAFGATKNFAFKTPSDNPNDTLVVICGGDSRTDLPLIGETDNGFRRQNADGMVSKLRPDLVVFSGNFVLNFLIQYSLISDQEAEWKSWLDDWFTKTQTRIRPNNKTCYQMYPLIVAQGNHESAIDLYNLFDTPNQEIYYAHGFCGGLFRLYTLNTKTSITGNQLTFLTNDLSTHQNVKWKMADYCNAIRPHVSSDARGTLTYDYWPPLFQQYGVNLVSEVGSNCATQTWPIIPCSSGTDCDQDFIRNDTLGTVYIGEGGWGSPLTTPDDAKKWTRACDKIDNFNLLWISKNKIEVRTVIFSNSSTLLAVDDNHRFKFPANTQLWDNAYGKVLVIGDRQHLPTVKITGPADNSQISSINNVLLSADASDPDGSVAKVQFYSNDSLIGTALTPPYQINHVFPGNRTFRITALVFDNEGNDNISFPITLHSGLSRDTLIDVITGMDDAEENIATGAVDLSSSRLDFYVDTLVGVRFSRPNIPQGKEIVSAYVKFIAGTASNDTTNITIIGEYGNNSRVFQNLSYNISDRRLTNQTLCWSPASWNANDTVKTPDITSIINEIITQPGWTEYSNMGIIFRTSKGQRSVYSYEGDPTKAASLYYEFRTVDPFIGINENIPGLHSGIITEVYPNPARSIVNIRMESKKDVQLDVYDHLGRLCQSTQYDKPSGLYKLNVSDLKPGVYFIQVKSGEQTQTAKLLIN